MIGVARAASENLSSVEMKDVELDAPSQAKPAAPQPHIVQIPAVEEPDQPKSGITECLRPRRARKGPKFNADGSYKYEPHQGEHRQYMRDMILGANDGLVSMFLLIIGLAGGDVANKQILLAGVTGAVAGAISMALGEYLATKSQAEVYEGDLALEKEHFKYYREDEVAQVRQIFEEDLLLKGDLLERAVQCVGSNDEAMLKIMMAFEFGQNEADQRSPIVAMLISGALFISGSLPSWLPFCFTDSLTPAIIASSVLSGFFMFVIGAVKTISTKTNWIYSGLENFIYGAIGAGLSYGLGALYEYLRSL